MGWLALTHCGWHNITGSVRSSNCQHCVASFVPRLSPLANYGITFELIRSEKRRAETGALQICTSCCLVSVARSHCHSQREAAERLAEVERRHLQAQLSYEEAIIARQSHQRDTHDKARAVKEEVCPPRAAQLQCSDPIPILPFSHSGSPSL